MTNTNAAPNTRAIRRALASVGYELAATEEGFEISRGGAVVARGEQLADMIERLPEAMEVVSAMGAEPFYV